MLSKNDNTYIIICLLWWIQFYEMSSSVASWLKDHPVNKSLIPTTAKYLKYWCKCDVIYLLATRQTVYTLHECVYSVVSISWYPPQLFAQDFPQAYLDSPPEKYFTYSCINNVNSLLTLCPQKQDQSPKHDTPQVILHFRVSV